jgi:hypothetical protein
MVLHDQKIMLENCIFQNLCHEITLMVEIPFDLEQLLWIDYHHQLFVQDFKRFALKYMQGFLSIFVQIHM